MGRVIYEFSPYSGFHQVIYQESSGLVELLNIFTVKDFIESIFVAAHDTNDVEERVWLFMETRLDSNMMASISTSTMYCIQLYIELLTEAVDTHLRNRLSQYNLPYDYFEYRFHQWFDLNTAGFTRPGFETGV